MTGLLIGTVVTIAAAAGLAVISERPVDDFMRRHPKAAAWLNWFEPDVCQDNHQGTKKAPAAATAGAKNYLKNIYHPSISRADSVRKAAK